MRVLSRPDATLGSYSNPAAAKPRARTPPARRWWLFLAAVVVTAIILVPIALVVILSLRPDGRAGTGSPLTLANFRDVLSHTDVRTWLGNSMLVTVATVVVSVCVAAPAGYVVSRSRSRAVSGYSLLLFVIQSLPVVTTAVPLYFLFSKVGLLDSLTGVGIVYVGGSIAVATWMMAAYLDVIPESLEQASWIDGCSPFGGFLRIVLRNALPGIVSTAIFTFLVSWNDYLVATIFLISQQHYTLPIGLEAFQGGGPSVMAVAVIMMAPPVIVFTVLNRFFSVGGIGGAPVSS